MNGQLHHHELCRLLGLRGVEGGLFSRSCCYLTFDLRAASMQQGQEEEGKKKKKEELAHKLPLNLE